MKGDLKLQRMTILVVGILILVFLMFAPDEEGQGRVPPSSFYTKETGAKALYLAVEELGLDVERWMLPADELGIDELVVVSLAPSEELDRLELDRLLEYVEDGGVLVYAAKPFKDPMLEKLGIDSERSRSRPEKATELSTLATTLLEGLPENLELRDRALVLAEVDEDTEVEALYADGKGNARVALLTRGYGEILLLSSPEGLLNEDLAESELAALVLRMIALFGEDGTVVFDEFHHGFEDGHGLLAVGLDWLGTTHSGWAALALFLIGFTALFTAGVRQGRPIPPPPKPRRSSLEHVGALAAAYEGSRAIARPARELALGLRLELRTADLEPALEQLRGIAPRIEPDVDRILAALRGPVDLVRLASSIDRVRVVAEAAASGRMRDPRAVSEREPEPEPEGAVA